MTQLYAGMRVNIIPEAVRYRRHLKDRLASWPWNIHSLWTDWEPSPMLVKNPTLRDREAMVDRTNGVIYATQRVWAAIRKATP